MSVIKFDILDDTKCFIDKGPFFVEWMKVYNVDMFDGKSDNCFDAARVHYAYWKVLTDRGSFYFLIKGVFYNGYEQALIEYTKRLKG